MLRSILLGKVVVAIVASLVTGTICVTVPWRVNQTWQQAIGWWGVGSFFIVLAIALTVATFFMLRKKF